MTCIWVFLFWPTIASLEKCAHEYILKVVSQSRMNFCKRALLLMDQDSPRLQIPPQEKIIEEAITPSSKPVDKGSRFKDEL